jgi:hypothetical protein
MQGDGRRVSVGGCATVEVGMGRGDGWGMAMVFENWVEERIPNSGRTSHVDK